MICLDTNVVIAVINRRRSDVVSRFDAELERGTRIVLPSIVLFEMHYGIAKSGQRRRNTAVLEEFLTAAIELAPFDFEDASEAGAIRAHLERVGSPIGPYDVLIAAGAA